MLITNLLERKLELASHKAYAPKNKEEADYVDALQTVYNRDVENNRRSYRYFQDRSLQSYMQRADDDSFLYVQPTRKDTWRSRTRDQGPRTKENALLSLIVDQNFEADIYAHDVMGKDMGEAADTIEGLVRYSEDVEGFEEKKRLLGHELLKYGTLPCELSFVNREKISKRSIKTDPRTGVVTKWVERSFPDFQGIVTTAVPLNRVLLGDVTKYFIEDQPHIWKEYLITYDEAYNLYHEFENWEFVHPVDYETDSWLDTVSQLDTQNYTENNWVKVKVYENKWSDECAILLNNVLMTPVGHPLSGNTKDKQYSLTWTPLEPYSNDFAYGRSFFSIVHNNAIIKDFLYNALVDKARQGLEPPLISSFRTLINKNMFEPGKVTQGDIQTKSLVNHSGITNADVEMIKLVDEYMDKDTVTGTPKEGPAGSRITAYEIREQQKAALRLAGLAMYSYARMIKDITEKRVRLILEHYPHLKQPAVDEKSKQVVEKLRTFVVHGTDGAGTKEIQFGKLPSTPAESYAMRKELSQYELSQKRLGRDVKKVIVDPDVISSLRYTFKMVVNPSQRKSKLADSFEAREDAAFAVQLPGIDPMWATKMWLKSKNYNANEAMLKEQPGAQPGMPGPGGTQPGGMPPAPGTQPPGQPNMPGMATPGATPRPPQPNMMPPSDMTGQKQMMNENVRARKQERAMMG